MRQRIALLLLLLSAFASAQQTPTPAAAPAGAPQPKTLDEATDIVRRQWVRLQDWPQLGRYRLLNQQLGPPQKSDQRVVFLGDSITDGWKLEQYFPGKPYVNRGISGQTTPQMLVRMMPDVIDLQPRAVLILAGTNDLSANTGPESLQDIERNYRALAELARQHNVRVIFASLLPVSDYGPRPMTDRRPPDQIRALNAWLQQYCRENKLTYLDYYGHMLDDQNLLRKELSRDGLHPNDEGYKIMAPLAEQAIAQTLKKKK